MPKKFHAAPGQSAGYAYQFERAPYWLARSPAGAVVGIETDDDVATKSGAISLLEQDKHSINAGSHPFGDRSKDLWNTLSIWQDAIEENRVEVKTARFLMVTNQDLPECLAKAIGRPHRRRRLASASQGWNVPQKIPLKRSRHWLAGSCGLNPETR